MIVLEVKGLEGLCQKARGGWKLLWHSLKREVDRQSYALTAYVQLRHLTGGTTIDRLAVRTGHLRRSTVPIRATDDGIEIKGGIRFGVHYASVHVGPRGKKTVIRPRRSKYLAIPLAYAKTKAGVARGAPRDFPGTFIVRTQAGTLLIAQKLSGKGILPLFVLKNMVVIPARIHPEDIEKAFRPQLIRGLTSAIRGAIAWLTQ